VGDLSSKIYEVLRENGLNPYVVSGTIGVLIVLFHRRDLLNWSAIPSHRRRFIVIQLLAALLLIILGILSAFNLLHE
jgi:hypothetical protein